MSCTCGYGALWVLCCVSAHISKPTDAGHLLNVFIPPPSPLEAMTVGFLVTTLDHDTFSSSLNIFFSSIPFFPPLCS